MRRTRWALAAAAVLAVVTVTGGVLIAGEKPQALAAQQPRASTAQVERIASSEAAPARNTLSPSRVTSRSSCRA